MIQEVIVKANAHEALRPLVQAAIRNQLKILQQGIDLSRERIAEFEKITGMSSAEFEKKLLGREIEDTLDVLDLSLIHIFIWMRKLRAARPKINGKI